MPPESSPSKPSGSMHAPCQAQFLRASSDWSVWREYLDHHSQPYIYRYTYIHSFIHIYISMHFYLYKARGCLCLNIARSTVLRRTHFDHNFGTGKLLNIAPVCSRGLEGGQQARSRWYGEGMRMRVRRYAVRMKKTLTGARTNVTEKDGIHKIFSPPPTHTPLSYLQVSASTNSHRYSLSLSLSMSLFSSPIA